MPAPVPPGFTRGPLLFVGRPTNSTDDHPLYQWFWDEAGGFGARILLIIVGKEIPPSYMTLHGCLTEWECEACETLHLTHRSDARDPANTKLIEQATAIALFSTQPTEIGPTMGGTPVAQTIRRSNARGKVVAGFGPSAAFLCQHMLLTPQGHNREGTITLANAVNFAPGLGLLNRLAIDVAGPTEFQRSDRVTSDENSSEQTIQRQLAAIAANPFLTPIALVPGSAAVLYPDQTLQALGRPGVTLIDGNDISAVDLTSAPTLKGVVGARIHQLEHGNTYNLDERTVEPGDDIDLPPISPPRTTL